jgi:hypothetical protein
MALFKYQLDVGFVQQTFFSKVSLSDSLPNFFALPCSSNHRLGLRDKALHFELGNVGQRGESLCISNGTRATHATSSVDGVVGGERTSSLTRTLHF